MLIKIKVICYLKLLISIKIQNQEILVTKKQERDTLESLIHFMKVEKQFLKACNTSENLLTKIIQNIYSLY